MGTRLAVSAYLTLATGYLRFERILSSIPVGHLTTIVVGVPLLAATAGGLLAGREPSAVAHQPIE